MTCFNIISVADIMTYDHKIPFIDSLYLYYVIVNVADQHTACHHDLTFLFI